MAHEVAPKAMRRNMPDPLPAMLLGRLAVDRPHHNRGLGSALLRDAMLRTLSISQEIGVALMFVHALHDQAIVVEPDETLRAGQG